jgi:preprotein translocase subunit SecF
MQFFSTPNIDFIGLRRTAYTFSLVMFLIGMASIFLHKGLNYGIDFKGGTSLVLRFDRPVDTGSIREALSGISQGGSEIKRFGSDREYIIYIPQQAGVTTGEIGVQVSAVLAEKIPGNPAERLQVEMVGPKIGEELRSKAFMAILISLALLLLYITLRFEFVFAVGAIFALFHDVVITLGFFSIMNYELSLKEIAAFLTLVGYSLNDTIVIFDRIRENLKIYRNDDLPTVMNKSINQTLTRSVNTSLTVFMVVLVMFLFGGEVIRGFSFIMLVGTIIGSYSTIFVASPIVLEWQNRHGGKNSLRMAKKHKAV